MLKKGGFEEAKETCKGLWVNNDLENIDPDAELISYETILNHIKDEIELEQNFIKNMKENNKILKKVYPFLKNIKNKDINYL